jgi:hypothetical protein
VLATPRERQARPLVGAALSACWGVGFGAVNVTHALAEAGLAPMRHYLIILDELWRALIAGREMVDPTQQPDPLEPSVGGRGGDVLAHHQRTGRSLVTQLE